MPTLRNDGNHIHIIERTDGVMWPVGPGETIETYDPAAASLSGMTQTSALPWFNPASSRSDLTSTGPGDDKEVALSAGTSSVEVVNNSVSVTISVFLDSTANTPGLKVVPQSTRVIDNLKSRAGKVVLQFSAAINAGECYVTQMK